MLESILKELREWKQVVLVTSPLHTVQNKAILTLLRKYSPKKITPQIFEGSTDYVHVRITYTPKEVQVIFYSKEKQLINEFGMLRIFPEQSIIYTETPFQLFKGYSPHYQLSYLIEKLQKQNEIPKLSAKNFENISYHGQSYPTLLDSPEYSG